MVKGMADALRRAREAILCEREEEQRQAGPAVLRDLISRLDDEAAALDARVSGRAPTLRIGAHVGKAKASATVLVTDCSAMLPVLWTSCGATAGSDGMDAVERTR